MRSGFAAFFMGIGGIFLCFSFVVFVLETLARRSDSGQQLATMSGVSVAAFLGGIILFGVGYLLNRIGRSPRNGPLTTDR